MHFIVRPTVWWWSFIMLFFVCLFRVYRSKMFVWLKKKQITITKTSLVTWPPSFLGWIVLSFVVLLTWFILSLTNWWCELLLLRSAQLRFVWFVSVLANLSFKWRKKESLARFCCCCGLQVSSSTSIWSLNMKFIFSTCHFEAATTTTVLLLTLSNVSANLANACLTG